MNRRAPLQSLRTLLGAATMLLLPACSSDPSQTGESLEVASVASSPAVTRGGASGATDGEPRFETLVAEDGVRGGELEFELDAPPDVVAARLMDFEGADGHRSWAETFEVLSERADGVLVTWNFRGRLGIRPSIDVDFTRSGPADDVAIDFHTVKKAFGISVFRGSYRVQAVPGDPESSRVTMRVFLDSGLAFANASHEDLEKGLREDARRIALWLANRT